MITGWQFFFGAVATLLAVALYIDGRARYRAWRWRQRIRGMEMRRKGIKTSR